MNWKEKIWPFWVSSVEEVYEVIEQYETENTVKFYKNRIKHKSFGKSDISHVSHFVRFEDKKTDSQLPTLEYDGIPFIVANTLKMDCMHGPDRKEHQKERNKTNDDGDYNFATKRTLVQNTKKLDCPARITVREIIKFPQFAAVSNSEWQRKAASKKVRTALQQGEAQGETRYYIIMPAEDEHKNHLVGKQAGYCQPMDDRLRKKVSELVVAGVDTVSEMKRHLEIFVTSAFQDCEHPDRTNRRFYPNNDDIRNSINAELIRHRHSKVDQENVEHLVSELTTKHQGDKLFFRPSIETEDDSNQSLLFVYQSQEQKSLLAKYGNEICLLDATYKTTRYALPLFLICVKTNLGYQPVSVFVVMDEKSSTIMEALGIVKEWNPDWVPKFFMTDFSESEILAIEKTFPTTQAFLCDFHREQAWERWVSTKINGVADLKAKVLESLRKIAYSLSKEDFRANVDDFKKSDHWKSSEALQRYFNLTWFPEHRRWVSAFRCEQVIAVNTNNGVESMNRDLKHNHLANHKNKTLSGMLRVLIYEYLPKKYNNYVAKNVMLSDKYRKYSLAVPEYLKNRPHDFIRHCMTRLENSREISENAVIQTAAKEFNVQSTQDRNKVYNVKLGSATELPSCQCQDWHKHKKPCKHMFAIFNQTSASWYDLSPLILDAAQFNIDRMVLDESVGIQDSSSEPQENFHTNNIISNEESSNKQPSSIRAAQKCRIVLREITNKTYLTGSDNVLTTLLEKLTDLDGWLSNNIEAKEGNFILEDVNKNSSSNKIKEKCVGDITSRSSGNYVYKPLPPRNRLSLSKRWKDRVGTVADAYQATVQVPDSTQFKCDVESAVIDDGNFDIPLLPEHEAETLVTEHESETLVTEHKAKTLVTEYETFDMPLPSFLEHQANTDTHVSSEKEQTRKRKLQQQITRLSKKIALSKKTGGCNVSTIISDENDDDNILADMTWVVIGKYILTNTDKAILESSTAWLNDNIINAAQTLLHQQNEHLGGFEDTLDLANMKSKNQKNNFIQILHLRNHWMTIQKTESSDTVYVYDSLLQRNLETLTDIATYVSNMIQVENKEIIFSLENVQKQADFSMCGLFAVAFAVALCHNVSPASVTFNTTEMRRHMLNCFEAKELTPFPIAKAQQTRQANLQKIKLYCHCNLPWNENGKYGMICCTQCENWFHMQVCENVPKKAMLKKYNWLCKLCTQLVT